MLVLFKKDKNHPLFLRINYIPRQSGYFITFTKQFEDKDRDLIASVVSCLHFKHGDTMLQFLTPESAERAVEPKWDPLLGCPVSPEYLELKRIAKECKNSSDWITEP